MKIDIGPQGRIVGTKRVSTSGQVAGLAHCAGKDVMIVLPEGRPSFHLTPRDYLHEWQLAAQRAAKRAKHELRHWTTRARNPEDILKDVQRRLKKAGVSTRIPSAEEARLVLEKRLARLRRQKQVRSAEHWLRSQLAVIQGTGRPSR